MAKVKRISECSPEHLKRIEQMVSKFPKPSTEYNEFGLRYPVDFLNSVKVSNILLPLEAMADFVDLITKENIDKKTPGFEDMVTKSLAAHHGDYTHYLNGTDATGIGNLAYVCMKAESEELKKLCHEVLDFIYTKQLEMVKTMLAKQASQYGIN